MTRHNPRHARKRDRKDTATEAAIAVALGLTTIGVLIGVGWYVGSWLLFGGNVK